MQENLLLLMKCFGYILLIYVSLGAIHSVMSVAKSLGSVRQYAALQRIRRKVKRPYFIPISIVVYSHNYEDIILSCVDSLLNLDFPKFEIIIVDDSLKEEGRKKLIEAFDLRPVQKPIKRAIFTQKIIGIYESNEGKVSITLVHKAKAKRGDSINAGINAAQYPFFLSVDGNMVLPKETLQLMVQPILGNDRVIACLGQVLRSSEKTMNSNNLQLPDAIKENFTSQLDTISEEREEIAPYIPTKHTLIRLISQGNFTLFRKKSVIEVNGYDTKGVGDDREIISKLAKNCAKNSKKLEIATEDDAVAYCRAFKNIGEFVSKYINRQKSFSVCIKKYRSYCLATGIKERMQYVHSKIYILWAPFIETVAMCLLFFGAAKSLYSIETCVSIYILYNFLYVFFTLASYLQRRASLGMRLSYRCIIKTMAACIADNFFIRYIANIIRVFSVFIK